jgi:rhamnosyltransferase subunit B
MHALLVSLGTDGDVFPYIGLGQRLRQRGHRVTLLSGERYRQLAVQSGFHFEALATEAETQEMLADPDLWHPWKCAFVIARWGVGKLEREYAAVSALLNGGDTVIIANPGMLAARMLHEQRGVPLVSVVLQPWVIPSITAPPVMPLGSLPRWAPRFVGQAYWALFHFVAHQFVGGELNRVRRQMGLPPVARTFQWWLSPQRVLGLFPDWYGPPQADWPAQIRLTGFPLFDGRLQDGLPGDVREFLDAGPPPVAVTFGTGMQHASRLFADVVQACELTGQRGILLTKHPEQLPTPLPPTVRHFAFAPFRDLFPLCAAVVHHGGVGTTAQCLAAGTPQLILPFAFDQPDNGVRIERLGVGTWFHRRRNNAQRIAAALERITTPEVRDRCRDFAERLRADDALTRAAIEIEQLEPKSL